MVTKVEPDPFELLTLLAMIGMTEIGGVWNSSEYGGLSDRMTDVVRSGRVRMRLFSWTEPPPASNQLLYTFKLTKKGYRYLGGFKPDELLWHWRNFSHIFDTRTQRNALIYIVKRLPVERLPEFLVHDVYEKVREVAKTRLVELR